jgi:hypothetical protein
MFFADGQWYQELERAEQFESLATAVQAAVKYHLEGAEVVLQLGEQPSEYYDIHFDLFDHGLDPGAGAGGRPQDRA